jgi:hypothetical protein
MSGLIRLCSYGALVPDLISTSSRRARGLPPAGWTFALGDSVLHTEQTCIRALKGVRVAPKRNNRLAVWLMSSSSSSRSSPTSARRVKPTRGFARPHKISSNGTGKLTHGRGARARVVSFEPGLSAPFLSAPWRVRPRERPEGCRPLARTRGLAYAGRHDAPHTDPDGELPVHGTTDYPRSNGGRRARRQGPSALLRVPGSIRSVRTIVALIALAGAGKLARAAWRASLAGARQGLPDGLRPRLPAGRRALPPASPEEGPD